MEESHRNHVPPIGLWGILIVVGWGMLALASIIDFFGEVGDLPNEDVAPAIFGVFGILVMAAGLGLAGLMREGLAWGARVALVIAASFFFARAAMGALIAVLGFAF